MRPTLRRQCWLFAIGASCFAVGTAPGFATGIGINATNVVCFVGSWFFTSAAWIQLKRSDPDRELDWYSAAVQFAGTVLFNISTGAAVGAQSALVRRRLVRTPDGVGSLAFLISGALAVTAVVAAVGVLAVRSRDWQIGWLNMAGCIAFGASAVASFVRPTGAVEDIWLANAGTFVGALCFALAALLGLGGTDGSFSQTGTRADTISG